MSEKHTFTLILGLIEKSRQHRIELLIRPFSGSHLVELSVLAPSGSDAIAEDMKNFAEQLRPLVSLDKIGASKIGFS